MLSLIRPPLCHRSTHRKRLYAPKYGIDYEALSEVWTDAERTAHEVGRTRALARYALIIRRPDRYTSQQIGHAAIKLAHLTGDHVVPAMLRAMLGGAL